MPGTGSCGGMYTANTMLVRSRRWACRLPYSSTMANPHDEKAELGRGIGAGAGRGDQEGPQAARHRHASKSIENAVARDHGHRRLDQRRAALPRDRARGRSGVDHRRLRAHAQEDAGAVRPQALAASTSRSTCTRPAASRRCMKILLDAGLLHGDCITITGKTIAEMLKDVPDEPRADQDVIRPIDKPMYARGPPRDPEGQPRARRLRGQDHRPEEPGDHRPGARVRRRAIGAGRRSWPARSRPAT